MRFLRTNTAARVTVGPFLDKTDGITPEVSLTVTSEKLTLMVDDGNVPTLVLDVAPTASGGANDMVHVTGDDAGFYDLELAAANVNYVGRAILGLNDVATHCPVFHEFMILPTAVYDALILGSTVLSSNVVAWNNVVVTVDEGGPGCLDKGTLAAITNTTATLATGHGLEAAKSLLILLKSGTNAKGKSRLMAWNTGDEFIVDPAWNTGGEVLPSGTITYEVYLAPPAPTSAIPNVNTFTVSTDALTADALAADAVAEIWAKAGADPAAVPAVTASMEDKINWLCALARNTITQTATTQLLKADDGTTTIGTSTISDNGTTFSRGEFA